MEAVGTGVYCTQGLWTGPLVLEPAKSLRVQYLVLEWRFRTGGPDVMMMMMMMVIIVIILLTIA